MLRPSASPASAARNGLLLRAFLIFFLLAAADVFAGTQTVWLGWDIAPADESIVEYHVLYGTQSGQYTNVLLSYNWDGAVISGLKTGVTYYFAVIGTDAVGQNTPLSAELAYAVPEPQAVELQTEVYVDGSGVPYGLAVFGTWSTPANWKFEYSTDLASWFPWQVGAGTTAWTFIEFSQGERYFFRLAH